MIFGVCGHEVYNHCIPWVVGLLAVSNDSF